jgi:hypothetical protein
LNDLVFIFTGRDSSGDEPLFLALLHGKKFEKYSSRNSWSLNLLDPYRPVQAYTMITLLFYI